MNNDRRKAIEELYKRVELIKIAVENLPDADEPKELAEAMRDEEQEYIDNMPEAFQNGEKGERASEARDQLDTATDKLNEVAEGITQLSDTLQEVLEALDSAKA